MQFSTAKSVQFSVAADTRHAALKADYILANPPFNVSDWGAERLKDDQRWRFGTPPKGNANFAWVQHMVHHLSPAGVAGFVLARFPPGCGFLARDRSNGPYRDRRGEVLFIDARQLGRMVDRTHRELTDEDVSRIADTYHAWRSREAADAYQDDEPFEDKMRRLAAEWREQVADTRRLDAAIEANLRSLGFPPPEGGPLE